MNETRKQVKIYEEIAELADRLSSHAAKLTAALKDLDSAYTRIEATESSLLAIQDAIFKEIRRLSELS